MHVVDHVPHYLVFDTMLAFHSLLSARVSEFGFFHPSCLSLFSLLHNITLPFHSLLSAQVLEFTFFHPMS